MAPASWLHVLATEIAMAPGFLAALDHQLRAQARKLTGIDLASGDYTLLPPDSGFAVEFHTAGVVVVGSIEGYLVDPSAYGHPVALAWRSTEAPDQPIQPDQERGALEFFWLQFPIAELAAGTHGDTSAAATAVAAPFPIEWDVHQWSSVWLVLHAHRAFTMDELTALTAVVQRAVRNWNAGDRSKIQYLAEPEIAPERVAVMYYLDLGVAGTDGVVAVINALAASPAAGAIARCTVGRRR